MISEDVAREEGLPSPEERRRILQHAEYVLAEARSVMGRLDETQGLVPASMVLPSRSNDFTLTDAFWAHLANSRGLHDQLAA
jgi:hypothetical protein